MSFKIDGGKDRIQESINEIIIEDKKQVNQEIKKFDIIQKDSKTIEFLQIEFSGSVEKIGKERIKPPSNENFSFVVNPSKKDVINIF